MALSEPFDLLADFPGWVTLFEPSFRQEQSRQVGGRTFVKDLGDPLWRLRAQSRILSPNLLDYWRARLEALQGGLKTFKGYSLSRTYPIAYPRGSWPTGGAFDGVSASLNLVGVDRKSVAIGDLPVGFKLSPGDMIAIGTDLHRVMENAIAAGTGITNTFEVFPNIWPGVTAGGDDVSVYRPSCLMAIVPGSISSGAGMNGRGSVAFEAIEAR